jgi:hypothetical protein
MVKRMWDKDGECWVTCPHCIRAMSVPKYNECSHPEAMVKLDYYQGKGYCQVCGLVQKNECFHELRPA